MTRMMWLLSVLVVPAIVVNDAQADDLPMTGKPDKKFAAFDAAIQKFMQERDISAGVIAVRYRNQLAYERGYGWSDEAKSKKVEPNALFRIAGLSKPITAAAVRQLILQKKLTPSYEDRRAAGVETARRRHAGPAPRQGHDRAPARPRRRVGPADVRADAAVEPEG